MSSKPFASTWGPRSRKATDTQYVIHALPWCCEVSRGKETKSTWWHVRSRGGDDRVFSSVLCGLHEAESECSRTMIPYSTTALCLLARLHSKPLTRPCWSSSYPVHSCVPLPVQVTMCYVVRLVFIHLLRFSPPVFLAIFISQRGGD